MQTTKRVNKWEGKLCDCGRPATCWKLHSPSCNRCAQLDNIDWTGVEREDSGVQRGINPRPYNSKPNSGNSTGIKGIHFCKITKKFVAQIRFNGKGYNLGKFKDIKDAIKVREKFAQKHFLEREENIY